MTRKLGRVVVIGSLTLALVGCTSGVQRSSGPSSTKADLVTASSSASIPGVTTAAASSESTATSVEASSATSTALTAAPRADGAPASRRWFEAVEAAVRQVRPTPPEAARAYAYVAAAYADAVDVGGSEADAGWAVLDVLAAASPSISAALRADPDLPVAAEPHERVASVTKLLIDRTRTDGFADAPVPTRPDADGLWRGPSGKAPLSPNAGGWKRWLVGGATFTVDAPPAPGSAAQQRQLAAVRRAVAARDARWANRIEFWGGAPGTNTPSGIWQDVAWGELGGVAHPSDGRWARLQAILAKTMADAFAETWQVKYTHWTARPDMVDPTLVTAMADPMFPSYVSGHSTVSAAAAAVLGYLAPGAASVWNVDAAEARDSRLMAGIHFPVDNDEGFALGRSVGARAVAASPFDRAMFTVDQQPAPATLSLPPAVLGDASPSTLLEDERDGVLPMKTVSHSPGTHEGNGVLVRLSKPGHDRGFVVATVPAAVANGRLADGWTATVLSRDPMWSPAACGGVPTALVGGRWVVYLESVADEQGTFHSVLVSFDVQQRRFASYLPEANDVAYTGAVVASGDHFVEVGFDFDGASGMPLRSRLIDLRDGSYRDHSYRWNVDDAPLVDGVHAGSTDARGDVPFVDAAGVVKARIHDYRAPWALGWSGGSGYLNANDGTDGEHMGTRNFGVYDLVSSTWDWALRPDPSPDAPSVLPLGTTSI